MRLRACVLAIAVVLPIRAFAQTPPPAPPPAPPAEAAPPAAPAAPAPAPAAVVVAPAPVPAPAPAAPPAAPLPKFVFGGLVDTYYMYNFTPPSGDNSLSSVQPLSLIHI